jgi:hypothetical protein
MSDDNCIHCGSSGKVSKIDALGLACLEEARMLGFNPKQPEPVLCDECGGSGRSTPSLWTSYLDTRDGTVVTVIEVNHWGRRIAVLPKGGQGSVRVEVLPPIPPRDRHPGIYRIEEWEFKQHFQLIYDPSTGYDAPQESVIRATA